MGTFWPRIVLVLKLKRNGSADRGSAAGAASAARASPAPAVAAERKERRVRGSLMGPILEEFTGHRRRQWETLPIIANGRHRGKGRTEPRSRARCAAPEDTL